MEIENDSWAGILCGVDDHTGAIPQGRLCNLYVRRYIHSRHHSSEVRAHLFDALRLGGLWTPDHCIHHPTLFFTHIIDSLSNCS
ncbi:hypothetical protein D3C81_1323320 [compost metagenome]